MRFRFALLGGLVELFVIGERVRIGACHACMDQRGPAARAAIFDGFFADSVTFEWVGAVALSDLETGETADEARDAATGGLDFDRNADGVAVVFDHVE